MSSGTRYQPDAFKKMAGAIDQKAFDRIRNLGMSPRQMTLNRLWSYYCCSQYEARSVDWDGTRRPNDPVEKEAIATAGFIPPGFYDAGGQMNELPLKYRRPSTPYHLAKVIVDRFTGLLFSERRHPAFRVEGDPLTEDWVHALVESSRLWPSMYQARTYGGSMGSVVTGFQFVNGKPLVEVHDPRWVFPEFTDRHQLTLAKFEKKYMYPQEVRDPESGLWVTIWFWYRRIVDRDLDVVFAPVPVGNGDEPDWIPERVVDHRLGFCPAVWTQNIPVNDDIDGEPDFFGITDMLEQIDCLLSQANRGVIANCDPTLVMTTDMELAGVRKGSNNAIKLEKGGSANYMEITGSGPKAAMDYAEQLRKYSLEVAQCVLEHPDVAAATATEIQLRYESMLAKADILREQYGERLVKPLVGMMIEAARALGEPRPEEGGGLVRYSLSLPPKYDEGQKIERKLGPGGLLTLMWPQYFEPTLQDAQSAATAAGMAKASGLLDDENAATFVAPFFRVDDVPGMLKRIDEEKAAQQAALESELLAQMPEPEAWPQPPQEPELEEP